MVYNPGLILVLWALLLTISSSTQSPAGPISHSPALISVCRQQWQICWQKSSSYLCVGQGNMRFCKINKLFYYNCMRIFTHQNIIALLTSVAYHKCKFCPLSSLWLFFFSSLSVFPYQFSRDLIYFLFFIQYLSFFPLHRCHSIYSSLYLIKLDHIYIVKSLKHTGTSRWIKEFTQALKITFYETSRKASGNKRQPNHRFRRKWLLWGSRLTTVYCLPAKQNGVQLTICWIFCQLHKMQFTFQVVRQWSPSSLLQSLNLSLCLTPNTHVLMGKCWGDNSRMSI